MPVQVTREFVFTDDSTGKKTVFSQKEVESFKSDTSVTLTCSGPRCQARHARPEPFTLTWKEEELAKNAEAMPDSFFQILKLGINTSPATELVFCSASCCKDFLTFSYCPPLSPREQRLRAKQEQTEKLAELNPHLVRKTYDTPDGRVISAEEILAPEKAFERGRGLPSEADLDSVAREKEIADATGGEDQSYKFATTLNRLVAETLPASPQADGDPGDCHE